MSQSPNPHVTARRKLAQRIERLLRPLDGRPVPTLTDWQADQVLAAIEAAEEERFTDGDRRNRDPSGLARQLRRPVSNVAQAAT